MKKIIHLSDLHFGTEREGLMDMVINDIKKLQPDFIIVSGDSTQRARPSEYLAAKQFFEAIRNENILCVAGNHDIPLYNLIARFFFPFYNYKKFITTNLNPFLIAEKVAILGINSVTPYKPMSGYVTEEQLQHVAEFFNKQPNDFFKIVVMHHNLIRSQRHKIINDSEKIIKIFAACNINLILSGHIHAAYVEQLQRSHFSHNMYVVTAGTAVSSRTKEPNSYNVIELYETEFKVIMRELIANRFVDVKEIILPR